MSLYLRTPLLLEDVSCIFLVVVVFPPIPFGSHSKKKKKVYWFMVIALKKLVKKFKKIEHLLPPPLRASG